MKLSARARGERLRAASQRVDASLGESWTSAAASTAAVVVVVAVIVDRAKRAKELVFLPFRATPCRAVPCSVVSRSDRARQRLLGRATSKGTRRATRQRDRERERTRERGASIRAGEKRERVRVSGTRTHSPTLRSRATAPRGQRSFSSTSPLPARREHE